jgi:hypothetical protein
MPRKPLGTYARTMADWWYAQSNTTGFNLNDEVPAAADFVSVSLYNDGMQGTYLFLDAIDIWFGNAPVVTYHVAGVDGKEYQDGIPILSGLGKLAGAIYYRDNAAPPPLYPGPTQQCGAFQSFSPGPPIKVRSRGPLAVIKPGYSYTVLCLAADGVSPAAVNFYWTSGDGRTLPQ